MAVAYSGKRHLRDVLRWRWLLAVLLVAVLATFVVTRILAGGGPALTSDKQQYNPGETVFLLGSGFEPSSWYDVVVERPDGTIVIGDGSETPGWDTVLTNAAGTFSTTYLLNGEETSIPGEYFVRVYDVGEAHISGNELATTNFFEDDTGFPTQLDVVKNDLAVTVSGLWAWPNCDNETKPEKHVGFGIVWGELLQAGQMAEIQTVYPGGEIVGTIDIWTGRFVIEIKSTKLNSLKPPSPAWLQQLGMYVAPNIQGDVKTASGLLRIVYIDGDKYSLHCPDHGLPSVDMTRKNPDTSRQKKICPVCLEDTGEIRFLVSGDGELIIDRGRMIAKSQQAPSGEIAVA
ncbi:MAG: hypothetical protein IIC91_13835 [Chloroflexi bacterium]|nr:hypothetical protein [Chloroflexota bacterium]